MLQVTSESELLINRRHRTTRKRNSTFPQCYKLWHRSESVNLIHPTTSVDSNPLAPVVTSLPAQYYSQIYYHRVGSGFKKWSCSSSEKKSAQSSHQLSITRVEITKLKLSWIEIQILFKGNIKIFFKIQLFQFALKLPGIYWNIDFYC